MCLSARQLKNILFTFQVELLDDQLIFHYTLGNETQRISNVSLPYKINVPELGFEYTLDEPEILTNPLKIPYKWTRSTPGLIPASAVVCANESGKIFYCGRMRDSTGNLKALIPVKINNDIAEGAGWNGVVSGTDFEYLVYDY